MLNAGQIVPISRLYRFLLKLSPRRLLCAALIFLAYACGIGWRLSTDAQTDQKAAQTAEKPPPKKTEQYVVKRLTQGSGLHQLGPVSPDGKLILLIGKRPDHSPNLYIMDLESRRMRPPLTDLRWGAADPQWSPDGKLIALSGFDESSDFSELYTYDLGSRDLNRLTRNHFSDKEPVFMPDGKRLLYTPDESPLPDAAFGILHVASIQ